jgi:hypothetical protein
MAQLRTDASIRVLITAAGEIGWDLRLTRHVAYHVVAGVDVFTNGRQAPVLPRFRSGVVLSF